MKRVLSAILESWRPAGPARSDRIQLLEHLDPGTVAGEPLQQPHRVLIPAQLGEPDAEVEQVQFLGHLHHLALQEDGPVGRGVDAPLLSATACGSCRTHCSKNDAALTITAGSYPATVM